MSKTDLAIVRAGLVTSVGLSAPASCAAFRSKISNPSETRFIDSGGQWIMAHQVELEQPWRGLTKLAKMAAMAIDEAMQAASATWPRARWRQLPLLLCVAEKDRPGRTEGLDDRLLPMIAAELGVTFAEDSVVVAHGRAGVGVALVAARGLVGEGRAEALLGAPVPIVSGWRSPAQQQWLWDHRATNPYPVARPGTSMHERGLAIDVPRWFVADLRSVAGAAGLCFPLPESDPVHFELCRPAPVP